MKKFIAIFLVVAVLVSTFVYSLYCQNKQYMPRIYTVNGSEKAKEKDFPEFDEDIFVRSNGECIAPYVDITSSKTWSENGWVHTDSRSFISNLDEIRNEIPTVVYNENLTLFCRKGYDLREIYIYDDYGNLLTSVAGNLGFLKLLNENMDSCYISVNVRKIGEYNFKGIDYETFGYNYGYKVVLE